MALTDPPDESTTDLALPRVRIAIVTAIGAGLALAAGQIFGTVQWWLLLPACLPGLVAVAVVDRRWVWRTIAMVAAVVTAVAGVVWAADGGAPAVVTGFTGGVQRLLSTEWPSPIQPDLLATVAAGLGVTVAIAAALARSARWHLAPLVPLLACWTAIIALSAPAGPQLQWLVPLGVLCMALATMRPGARLAERWALLRGERQLAPILGLSALAAGLLAVPISFDDRADPRRTDPPDRSATLLDPVEAARALREVDPPVQLYEIDVVEGEAPRRWRTAALADYDGQRWVPDLTLRPIGSRLGTTDRDVVAAEVRVLNPAQQLVPLPGAAISATGPIQTDDERTIVRLDDRIGVDGPIAVEAAPEPSREDVPPGVIGTREVGESVSALQELADQLAGDGSVIVRLDELARTMRDEFALDSSAPGGGLQRALVDRFLRDTKRGNEEQFVSGFVLLAQALGVDARVATGFEVDPDDLRAGSFTLDSDEALVWPEVRLVDDGWISFDPVPDQEAATEPPDPPEAQTQTPAAAQPPVEPPSQPRSEPNEPDETEAVDTESPLAAAVWAVARAALVLAAMVTPFLIAAGLVLGIKLVRRRRRLGSPDPTDRIRGAWSVATDDLVDAGLAIDTSATDGEIAQSGAEYAVGARPELRRLARLSGAATFGQPVRPDMAADDAVTCLGLIDAAIADERSRLQRARWRLSLRSLRRATRSPV